MIKYRDPDNPNEYAMGIPRTKNAIRVPNRMITAHSSFVYVCVAKSSAAICLRP
jgi:hypothetical protein